MFEFTIRENDFLNGFLNLLSDYVNKSYKFTMSYLTSPLLSDVRESERLVLLVVNKSVFQNMYSFIKLNDSNMQFASFSCLETAVNSMRLYNVLATNPDYMHEYITGGNFSLEVCENEISEKDTYERAKTAFATEADSLETQTEYISQTLQNVFDFMEAAFGDSQEMVAFITELNANYYSLWFIRENGSDQYYRHNKGLLFDNRQKQSLGQMEELEQGNNFPSVLK